MSILNNIDLVIVSDVMDQMTKDTITSSGIKNVYVEKFQGYNKSLNIGALKGKSEWIAFCNNDLIFGENWHQHITNKYDSLSGWCPNTHHQFYGKNKPKFPIQKYTVGKVLTGWCIIMKRNSWEKLKWNNNKGFDERLTFWCCDNAASKQMINANVKHALIPKMEITHLESQTLNKQNKEVYENLTKQQVKIYNRLYNENLFNLGR